MKKLYYLLSLAALTAFSACNPLDKTYKEIGSLPSPATIIPKRVVDTTFTLATSDFKLLPSTNPASTAGTFISKDDASTSIPSILTKRFVNILDKSKAVVTYGLTPTTIKVADTVFSHVAYTVTPADYVAAATITKTTFKDYSDAQVLLFLTYLYPNPVANQLSVLTYTYYASGVTPSSGVPATDSFLYLNGSWVKIYTVSNAQYASIGRANYNQFVAADEPNIGGYLAALLKSDPTVSGLSPKVGDVKYVSYNQYVSSTKSTFQRVLPLTFDGVNWGTAPLQQTLLFSYSLGVWSVVADNTITYKLVTADYAFIKGTTVNVQAARDNVAQYGDFNISTPLSTTTGWSDADINSVIALILAKDFPNAVANQTYVITYAAYNGATISVTKTFIFDGTTFKVKQ